MNRTIRPVAKLLALSTSGLRTLRGLTLWLLCLLCVSGRAEIVFRDFFIGTAGSLTNHTPWIDYHNDGWAATSNARLDGQGQLVSGDGENSLAAFPLLATGPHGAMTAFVTVYPPLNAAESISIGFNSTVGPFNQTNAAGPWLQLTGDGKATLFAGSGPGKSVAVFPPGSLGVRLALTCDVFTRSVTVSLGGTNTLFDSVPLAANFQPGLTKFFVVQFAGSNGVATTASLENVALDWLPRFKPLLAFATTNNVLHVGPSTGSNDVAMIQRAFNDAAKSTGTTEVRFTAGATYLIDSASTDSAIPLTLNAATNVLVNGNGSQILIKNPRVGFLHVTSCTNVIVRGFVVDYDPLPFTQGTVTRNFYTDPQGAKAPALEVQLDDGYPAPTAANYVDTNAVQSAGRWVLVMDPDRPGRSADNTQAQYVFKNITLDRPGFYHVQMASGPPLQTIPEGSRVCLVSRWDGSPLFGTAFSSQITYQDITNYTGPAANFMGRYADAVNLINCHALIGPPPPGATKPRVKTTNADGGIFGFPRIGPWVENCEFTGLSDDAANANAIPFQIDTGGGAPDTIRMAHLGGGALLENDARIGDDCTFYNPLTGLVVDRATIVARPGALVKFDHALTNLVKGQARDGTLVFNHTLNSSAVYLGNKMSNSRVHGIYCRANNMLVARNQVSGMGKNGIVAYPALDLAGPNSFLPTNVLIVANKVMDCGYIYDAITASLGDDDPSYAALAFYKKSNNSELIPEGREIADIRIINNSFLAWRRAAISLRNVTGIDIIGNYFGAPLTNNGFASLTNHVLVDLWAADYPTIRIKDNVSSLAALREEGTLVAVYGAFKNLPAPELRIERQGTNWVGSWLGAPAFTPQQRPTLSSSDTWTDLNSPPRVAGPLNTFTLPATGANAGFFRLRQNQ